MFRFRINKKWLVIAVLSCVLVTSSAFAISFRDTNSSTQVRIHYDPTDKTSRSNYLTQIERRSTFDTDKTSRLDTDKTSRFDYLTQIENIFNTIESTKLVTLEKSEEISNATKTYADRTKADLDIALKNATLLAETEGKSGEIQSLSRFEQLEEKNASRLQNIENRATAVDKEIRIGSLILDQSIIKTLSTAERADFLGSLAAPVQNKYTQSQPELFQNVSPNETLENKQSLPELFQNVNPSETLEKQEGFLPKTNTKIIAFNPVKTLSDIILPPAYAAVARPCIRYAQAGDWSNLRNCVLSAGSQATQIYNEFVDCWYNASGWLKWLKRAYCVTRLIIRLA